MAWSQAPSPCRRRKRGRQNHPATASRRGSGRTPTGLETERRTPPATLADRFSICSPLEHNGNIWPAVNRSQAGPATTIGGAGANGRSLRTAYRGDITAFLQPLCCILRLGERVPFEGSVDVLEADVVTSFSAC